VEREDRIEPESHIFELRAFLDLYGTTVSNQPMTGTAAAG
jgi:hypothetical protein